MQYPVSMKLQPMVLLRTSHLREVEQAGECETCGGPEGQACRRSCETDLCVGVSCSDCWRSRGLGARTWAGFYAATHLL